MCLSLRKRLTRTNTRNVGEDTEIETLKQSSGKYRQDLKNLINRSKIYHWKKLCKNLGGDIWSLENVVKRLNEHIFHLTSHHTKGQKLYSTSSLKEVTPKLEAI